MSTLPKTDRTWTLFLDRDGVINRRIVGDYVRSIEQFEMLPGVLESLIRCANHFGRIVVVTNQQGIGKGLMSEEDLRLIHKHFIQMVHEAGGRIDAIYHCPELAKNNPECRKPEIGMFNQARKDFPEIVPKKSIMVGDSPSDMEFGRRAGIHTVAIGDDLKHGDADFHFACLLDFCTAFLPA
jgi:D-glycero-D-manno-heptose 1,7-bisphosphate phosphatase